MKQYFISGTFFVTKNSAHEQAQKIAFYYNHCLIDEKRLEELIESFSRKVDAINKANKRCKDIKLVHRKFELPGHESQQIGIDGNFYLSIKLVERVELSQDTGRNPINDLMGDMKAH
jgi:murein endopeptidase